MAQFGYRANLSSKSFPFISANWGQTVIVPQYDNAFNPNLVSDTDEDRDVGIPQAFYMHNVFPTAQGFQSVGYTQVLDPVGGVSNFILCELIRDASGSKAYIGITASGQFYINEGLGWIYKLTVPVAAISIAFVSGITYIYVANHGCYRYDFASDVFVSVTLTGLEPTVVGGIVGAVGYLIAWQSLIPEVTLSFTTTLGSDVLTGASTTGIVINQVVSGSGIPTGSTVVLINPGVSITISQVATASATVNLTFEAMPAAVAWSSVIDPTDFTPSLITGAGGGAIEGARGVIVFCAAHTLGFIAYTTHNAVSAVYSNNARYPFSFREILSSGGLISSDLIAYDANTGNHYAYTTSGFQLVSTASCQTIFPAVTDFISGRLFEDYDETTKSFSRTVLSNSLKKKLTVISDRYLVISYGITSYTHALVYDISQKRWGKFKVNHASVFEYELISPIITEIPRQSIAFLQSNGTVLIVDFSPYLSSSSGVIALGKYQLVRSRNLILDEIFIENIYDKQTFDLTILSSFDGKSTFQVNPIVIDQSDEIIHYGVGQEARNHSLICKGNFHLTSLSMRFHLGGKR